jgi:hypothetical protein
MVSTGQDKETRPLQAGGNYRVRPGEADESRKLFHVDLFKGRATTAARVLMCLFSAKSISVGLLDSGIFRHLFEVALAVLGSFDLRGAG